jgi:hypothetical protein
LGALIVILSFILEPILACLHKRRKYKEYSYLEWSTNSTLQLHRLAQEELNMGTWSGCTDMIPITKANETMGSLDIRDLEHPVLAWPYTTAMGEKAMPVTSTQGGYENQSSAESNAAVRLTGFDEGWRPHRVDNTVERFTPERNRWGNRDAQIWPIDQGQPRQETYSYEILADDNATWREPDEVAWCPASDKISNHGHLPYQEERDEHLAWQYNVESQSAGGGGVQDRYAKMRNMEQYGWQG